MEKHTFLIILSAVLGVFVIALLSTLFFLYFKHKSAREAAKAVLSNKGNSPLAISLRDEKLKSEIILNTIDDGVILLDNNQIIHLFNPAAAKITGWPAEEARGLAIDSVIKLVNDRGEAYTDQDNPFKTIFLTGQTKRDNDAYLLTRSDKQVAIDLSISPFVDNKQRVTGAVAVFRDVNQERQEEAQRAEFISTASHEMRTPVAAIEGYLALALNDKVSNIDSHAREFLEKAHSSTQHLGKLFQDLLTSAKAEDGRLTNHPVVIEMGHYLEQLAQDLKFTAEKKGLLMEFMIGTSQTIDASNDTGNKVVKPLYYVSADPDRLREVITNLFDNAVKYTESGKISLGLTGNDQVVQFYVRDTGPGIPAEDVSHLFQKFYRVDNSATRTIGGTGLGLFICRKIIELYDGRIWAESEVGKGSTFFINLPRLSTQKASELQAAEANSHVLKPITSLASH
jgi:PAS domain S-box-containing protein